MFFGSRMMEFGGRIIGHGIGLIVIVAVLTLIVVGIIALVRYIRGTGHGYHQAVPPAGMPDTHTALQILNERYAKGEISDEEYRAKKAEILKQ